MIEAGLLALLQQQNTITNLVGQRIRPIPAPPDLSNYPCITFQVVSYLLDYTSDGETGFTQKRIVWNCWANSWMTAHTLLDAVRSTLSGFKGTLNDGTQVFLIEVENGQDYYDPDSKLYRVSLHTLIQYAE